MTHTLNLQGPQGLVLMDSTGLDQGQDQWQARILSPHPKAGFKSLSLIQTHKQNTLVFQKMDFHPPEGPVKHLSMTHLNKPP